MADATPSPFEGRRVTVGMGGGISAYKVCTVVSSLVQGGADVRVLMTEAATRFVGTVTLRALSGRPVLTSLWDEGGDAYVQHIAAGKDADLLLIAPATADLIAKFAAGFADNIVTAAVLAADCPVLLAPAMNARMWQNAATVANVKTLTERGFHLVGPTSGWLAERETGVGRMSEPAEILAAIAERLAAR